MSRRGNSGSSSPSHFLGGASRANPTARRVNFPQTGARNFAAKFRSPNLTAAAPRPSKGQIGNPAVITIQQCAESPITLGLIQGEAELVDSARQTITPEGLLRAARLHKVARQFPKRHGRERARDFEPIVRPLRQALDELSRDNLAARVEELAEEMARIPGLVRSKRGDRESAHLLSAASKFVWIGAPEIAIVYERWSAVTLRKLGYNVPTLDYGAFVGAHAVELAKHDADLDSAAATLIRAHPNLSEFGWLKTRLFDLWLYANGKPLA